MAKKVQVSIIINKPIGEVYSYITDPDQWAFWMDIAEVEKVSGNGEVGTIYNLAVPRVLGSRKTPIEITRKLAHIQFAFKDNSLSVGNETGFRLEEAEEGVLVTAYCQSDIGVIASVLTLGFLATMDTEQKLQKMLENLKSILEN